MNVQKDAAKIKTPTNLEEKASNLLQTETRKATEWKHYAYGLYLYTQCSVAADYGSRIVIFWVPGSGLGFFLDWSDQDCGSALYLQSNLDAGVQCIKLSANLFNDNPQHYLIPVL